MAKIPELKIEIESINSLDGDIILVKTPCISPKSQECLLETLEYTKDRNEHLRGKTVLIIEDLNIEMATVESLRAQRDLLNQHIYDLERRPQ